MLDLSDKSVGTVVGQKGESSEMDQPSCTAGMPLEGINRMQYQGGKSMLAKRIAEVVTRAEGRLYIEPFLGGGSTFAAIAPSYPRSIAGELREDVALMWEAVRLGWAPPSELSEDEYAALKEAEPSALRGFAGAGCSWGGKWFSGYARSGQKCYPAMAHRSIMKKVPAIRRADEIRWCDYTQFDDMMGAGVVVYCDPPYADATPYPNQARFDHESFWERMGEWSDAGAKVFVSEFTAPLGWECVWELSRPSSNGAIGGLGAGGFMVLDRLFTAATDDNLTESSEELK